MEIHRFKNRMPACVRQTGNSKKDKYWTEVRRQKPEEKHLITLFELRSLDFSQWDSFGRTPVKKKKFIETKVTVSDCRQASLQGFNQ